MNNLLIIGRRWFEKTNGNTYHSATIYVDGKCVHKIDFAYGYGNQFEWNAAIWLEKNGYLEKLEHYQNGGHESLWRYCEKRGISYATEVIDVNRKKDL
jgi:hypothetical protein